LGKPDLVDQLRIAGAIILGGISADPAFVDGEGNKVTITGCLSVEDLPSFKIYK
jgi:hypothetical protein